MGKRGGGGCDACIPSYVMLFRKGFGVEYGAQTVINFIISILFRIWFRGVWREMRNSVLLPGEALTLNSGVDSISGACNQRACSEHV